MINVSTWLNDISDYCTQLYQLSFCQLYYNQIKFPDCVWPVKWPFCKWNIYNAWRLKLWVIKNVSIFNMRYMIQRKQLSAFNLATIKKKDFLFYQAYLVSRCRPDKQWVTLAPLPSPHTTIFFLSSLPYVKPFVYLTHSLFLTLTH